MKFLVMMLVLALTPEASADDELPPVEVFVPGSSLHQIPRPEIRMVQSRFVGEVNTVELARGNPNLRLILPSGEAADFVVATFRPDRGIEIDESGNPVPSENPLDLTYFLEANGPKGQLYLSVLDGRVNGDLIGADPWSIRYSSGQTTHFVDDLDRDYLASGSCATEGVAELGEGPLRLRDAAPEIRQRLSPETMFEVTILFAYTPQALTYAGSTTALQSAAAAAVNQMNQALENSGQTIDTRVVQVGTLYASSINELTYAQEPTPANRHKYIRDQTLQEALLVNERETVDADFVVTIVRDEGNGVGQPPVQAQYGIAFLQRPSCSQFGDPGHGIYACNPGPDFNRWAFGVVSYDWVTTNGSFAHEAGHIFGAEHEPQRGTPSGSRELYPYAHRASGVVRDLMAQPECVSDSGSSVCTSAWSVQYSNPDTHFIGTTIPSGTLTPVYAADGSRSRNGSRIIREYASAMTDFEGPTQPTDRVFWDGFE